MGWFWGKETRQSDPTSSLSPELKDFLDNQQRRPYTTSEAVPPKSDPEPPKQPPQALDTSVEDGQQPLPRESLFQDGRYKDLWKTYVPQGEIEAITTTPVDRIIAARKDRRQLVHRAALENCAFENDMQLNCMHSGDILNRARARLTMCRRETKAFNRCFQLQAKFLQALGYLSNPQSTDADEERIQMHADKLYHRMMDYEASVEEAKQDKRPIPPLASVFEPGRAAPALEELEIPRSLEKNLSKPLHELPPHERELAVKAALQESKMSHVYVNEYNKFALEKNEERKNRQSWLIKAFGEPIGKFIIPDPPQDPDRLHPQEPDINHNLITSHTISHQQQAQHHKASTKDAHCHKQPQQGQYYHRYDSCLESNVLVYSVETTELNMSQDPWHQWAEHMVHWMLGWANEPLVQHMHRRFDWEFRALGRRCQELLEVDQYIVNTMTEDIGEGQRREIRMERSQIVFEVERGAWQMMMVERCLNLVTNRLAQGF